MFSWKSFRRRRSVRWLQSNLCYIILLLILFYVWSSIRSAHEQSLTCTTMSEDTYQTDMHRFVNKVHLILDKLRITHFLCYNALWGQIRYKRMFLWQREIEMCIVRKSEHSLTGLEEIFQYADIDIIYRGRRAEYLLNTEYLRGRVNLIVFQLDPISSTYFRPGWQYRVVPGEMFPSYLLGNESHSLPLKPFGPYHLPVPLHDMEIQKYHFPDTWWKGEDPLFC
ncbi:hypothetical protein M8J76_009653 [Diaphorina citri]|nr:hypothetical protein M8J75_003409 [Diaphorina citri]KAI5745272.1 hypothetical protein M8J76_009653 [Diaphorina citri]